jgi:ligand-binding SRPBCC domain-containing protein
MKLYRLSSRQFLPVSRRRAWRFFSSPWNLSAITPVDLNLKIVSVSGHSQTHAGQIIRFSIKVLGLFPVNWETAVTEVKDLDSFTDIQRAGPFSVWHHKHIFSEVNGGTEIVDEIEYAIPFGLLGRLAHFIFVSRQLKRLFAYRVQVLHNCLNATE